MATHPPGAIAAGHPQTVEAAAIILEAGGNAFDAVVAAHLAACVTEPVLASLGGGGYLLAHDGHRGWLYDFFVQTPRRRPVPGEVDFFPVTADFGTARQEFHIGLGSIATPGVIKGLFTIQRELGRLPMPIVAEPAVAFARRGVTVNALQAYIFEVVAPIYQARKETFAAYRSPSRPDRLVQAGDLLVLPELADTIETLAREGETPFYAGEIARRISELCRAGGLLTPEDLRRYQVIRRLPLTFGYRGSRILTNPPPSSGGLLIAFALKLLESSGRPGLPFGSAEHLLLLARVQQLTQQARREADLDAPHPGPIPSLLSAGVLDTYLARLRTHPLCRRGTTHISVMDRQGNTASLTTSNGEGCGHLIPGTGVMLNNMLGEEDLNPHGFCRWPNDCRMTSMMAPTIVQLPMRTTVALGSGGSNRLRTAILQVLTNLVDFRMPLQQAIDAPRLHLENGLLNLEAGFPQAAVDALCRAYPEHKQWPGRNLFFGGVHAVADTPQGFQGAGDPRRGGSSRTG